MSRTFKTNPPWVKLCKRGRGGIPVEVTHDPARGVCDLPEKPTLEGNSRCYYWFQYDGSNFFCGCSMCTNQFYRRSSNKSSRRKSNQRRKVYAMDPSHFRYEEYDEYSKTMPI